MSARRPHDILRDLDATERRVNRLELAFADPDGSGRSIDDDPDSSTWIGRERFDVTRYGMAAGVTEPVSKLQAAIDAAAAVKGTVFFPPLSPGGEWRIDGSAQLKTGVSLVGENGQSNTQNKGSVLRCMASAPALIMPNSGVGGYSQVAEVRIEGVEISSVGDCISVPNGGIDVVLRRLLLLPGGGAKAIHHKGFIQDWHVDDVRIEGWHGSIGASAHYGWYSDAENGAGGDGSRMDCCNFDYLYVSGCTRGNLQLRIALSDNVIFKMLRSVTCARHGVVLAGGFGSLVFIAPNFEANGYLGAGLSVSPTTGSMTSGSAVLTVASGTGLTNGTTVCVRRALNGLDDLVTTISSGGGTTTLTLAATAGYTVSGADVTKATYSDVYAGPDLGSPESLGTTIGGGPQNVTFINPGWGIWPLRDDHMLRYAADLSGITAPHVINAKAPARPIYDPLYLVEPFTDDPFDIARFTPSRKWQTPIFSTDWSTLNGFAVRRRGRTVEIRGRPIADVTAGTTVCVFPPGCRPVGRLVEFFVGPYYFSIDSDGVMSTNGNYVAATHFFDGFSFSID